ncbi:hypothetical protein BGW36DRAFT_295709 [Talaromyces proteolyticus]|uniref:ER-bound oxygenase mpaB/mpaB'/Rubber oxygenase catalytic domain-containing protein n=1 Tax=Talaromyces proteolyticus TaxID=1131652 RepID=A0AAD4Q0M3_9EURO|nr:uncharacterized protein BGW36DRAFT_295709 [Talaromyces proteolyticus]KAH8697338.1 hypothetical protein BGW36DRAFT_295709 [Talaromyces proteolyticus]
MAFYALPVLLAYLLLVKTLRFRRIDKLQTQYSTTSLASMTDREAWGIQKSMMELEFPFTFYKSLQFALFRTYGIPTISKTLTKTQLFANPLYSFKRYADTVLLIGEFTSHDPTSERTRIAIARTNFIHSPYLQSGAITPEDMLYTLSLFATEPLRFIDLYEWRSTTTLERCAMGVFWKSVGDALGIDYAGYLPSASKGFRDGNHWLQEVTAWAQEYEAKAMVPAQSNRETAEQTTALLTYVLPPRLKLIGEWFVSHMMDDRLRRAMIYDPAPDLANVVFSASFSLRKFILRYLTLPRPEFLRSLSFSEKPDPVTGTYHLLSWSAQPFYVKPTLWNRWLSPAALFFRILGLPVPGDQGDTFFPNGYHLDNVGPNTFSGKGKDFMEKQIKILEVERRGQCPFH